MSHTVIRTTYNVRRTSIEKGTVYIIEYMFYIVPVYSVHYTLYSVYRRSGRIHHVSRDGHDVTIVKSRVSA